MMASEGRRELNHRNAQKRNHHAKRRDQTVLALLEKIHRLRQLDEFEQAMMDRTIRKLQPPREVWRWSEKEDRALRALISRRAVGGRPRPFQPNDEIRNIAAEMGRTYMAVHRRIERLRKRDRSAS